LDYIIKGGDVFDGRAFSKADVALKDGKIAAVGKIDGPAEKIIDASGRVVSPGFIDVHTHCDLAVMDLIGEERSSAGESVKSNLCYLRQGVTTVVTGNCGLGESGTAKWLGWARKNNFGTNVIHLVPHGMLRLRLFGDKKILSHADIKKMAEALEEEMDEGARGFSTGLEYSPGCFASKEEIEVMARVCQRRGGVYATHMRSETGLGVTDAVDEAIGIAYRTGVSLEISHLKISAPLNALPAEVSLEKIEAARGEGLDVTADQYAYDYGSTYITLLVNPEFLDGSVLKTEHRKGGCYEALKSELESKFNYLPPERIIISVYPQRGDYEGKSISAIAEEFSRPPIDVLMELVFSPEPPFCIFMSQDIENVRSIMKKDYILSGSDGWTQVFGEAKPHPRSYGNFPRKLRQFVKDERLISLSHALRSMTSLPAEKFRIKDRGYIKEGYAADIAVFDPGIFSDRASVENPHSYAEGLEYLFVNGRKVIEKDSFLKI